MALMVQCLLLYRCEVATATVRPVICIGAYSPLQRCEINIINSLRACYRLLMPRCSVATAVVVTFCFFKALSPLFKSKVSKSECTDTVDVLNAKQFVQSAAYQ